jgi:hypothetical protein
MNGSPRQATVQKSPSQRSSGPTAVSASGVGDADAQGQHPPLQPRHSHRLRAGARRVQQLLGRLRVARPGALQQHDRAVEAAAGDQRASAHPLVALDRLGQIRVGLVPALEHRGHQPGVAGDRAEAGDHPAGSHVAVGVRREQLQQFLRPRGVAEERTRLGEHAQVHQPLAVDRNRAESRARQPLELASCLGLPPLVRVREGQADPPHHPRRVVARHLRELGLDLVEAPLKPAQREQLRGEHLLGVARTRPPPHGQRVAGQALGVLEAAVEHRPHGLEQTRVPKVLRVAERFGKLGVHLGFAVRALEVAELHQVAHPPEVPAQLQLAVAHLLPERDDVAGDGEPLVGVRGPPEREVAGVERGRQRRRVAEPLGHRDGLGAQLGALAGLAREVELGGEAAEDAGGEGGVAVPEGAPRLAEQSDEVLVDATELEPAQARAVAQRRAREQLGGIELAGQAGRALECLTRRHRVAAAALRLAECEQELAAAGHVGALLQAEDLQGALVVPGRRFVGELGHRVLAGAHGIVDRL